MLTLDGRCKALDSAADGYVRGEACITFLLGVEGETSPLGSELMIAGSAINQDGRSSSLTAPNGPSQQQVAYTKPRWSHAGMSDETNEGGATSVWDVGAGYQGSFAAGHH